MRAAIAVLAIVAGTALAMPSGSYCASKNVATGKWSVTPSASCEGVAAATATYNRSFEQVGWDRLVTVGADASATAVSDADRAYATGLLEGVLTADRIANQWFNQMSSNGSWPLAADVMTYFKANYAWMQTTFAEPGVSFNDTDPYWANMYVLFRQLQGTMDGATATGLVEPMHVFALSFAGDAFDIANVVSPPATSPLDLPKPAFEDWFVRNTHCSALFKLTADGSDIWFGHTTWAEFNMMLRIFKTVTMNLQTTPGVAAKTITYSSFPGDIASTDDFYVTSAGLAVIETSLSVFNMSIYQHCNTSQFLSSMRTMAANRMASSGPAWVDIFSRLNSGTYNNEWLVLDRKLFTPGQDLKPNTFTLADQMPGWVASADFTNVLSYGYVPSYNVPAIRDVFEYAGYPAGVAKQGPHMLDYHTCARANLFRELQTSVTDAASMQHMMQYNQFETNPIELGHPVYAIAARGDKKPVGPRFFGGLDTKFSSVMTMSSSERKVWAFSGPTPQQGVFTWADQPALAATTNRRGLPDSYAFTIQQYDPEF